MSYTTRVLPPEEWSRLAGTELESVWPILPVGHTAVLVVEDETGTIVGTWALVTTVHAEGLWVAPSHRQRAGVGRRLLRGLATLARQAGVSRVITGAKNDQVTTLLARFGAVSIGEQYVMPLVGEKE